jgi:hypothetical protein
VQDRLKRKRICGEGERVAERNSEPRLDGKRNIHGVYVYIYIYIASELSMMARGFGDLFTPR